MVYLISFYFLAFFISSVFGLSDSDRDLIDTIRLRRIDNIVQNSFPDQSVRWKHTLLKNGTWPDVDYTTGCLARRANWPAQTHMLHIMDMATAWHIGGKKDDVLLEKSLQGLDYWQHNDLKEPDCIDFGGNPLGQCLCETPGLWNRNWFDQVILIPRIIGYVCLMLQSGLSEAQTSKCKVMMERGYNYRDQDVRAVGGMHGANLLDVSSTGISLALFQRNITQLEEATEWFYKEAGIVSASDGIYSDGSFLQHQNQLYTGNYGKDFINQLLRVFIETSDTRLAPPPAIQRAFTVLMEGTEWMVIANQPNRSILWEYSVIGRMISTKSSDMQASSGVAINLTKVQEATQAWPNQTIFSGIVRRLTTPATSANQGGLTGTRFFHISDYLVHRMHKFVVTLKMFSRRTRTSECNNTQNKKGFHLSDGSIFTYQRGNEYVDVFGAWDWDLVPGITNEYGKTLWDCSTVIMPGNTDFVGGAALGDMGIAVMYYINPQRPALQWKKTYFFFPDAYAVDLGNAKVGIPKKPSRAHPLVTSIDQRKLVGDIHVDDRLAGKHESTRARKLWHDHIGYMFNTPASLTLDSTPRRANWSDIGISNGNETQRLFTAYVKHDLPEPSFQYTVIPNIDYASFKKKKHGPIEFVMKDQSVRGAYHAKQDSLALAFWTAGSIQAHWWDLDIKASQPCVVILQRSEAKNHFTLAVADPSQLLSSIDITLGTHNRSIQLPKARHRTAGSTVIEQISFEDVLVPSLSVPFYL